LGGKVFVYPVQFAVALFFLCGGLAGTDRT
jgi:hypothetical protein